MNSLEMDVPGRHGGSLTDFGIAPALPVLNGSGTNIYGCLRRRTKLICEYNTTLLSMHGQRAINGYFPGHKFCDQNKMAE